NGQYGEAMSQYHQRRAERGSRAKDIKRELNGIAGEMQRLIDRFQLRAEPPAPVRQPPAQPVPPPQPVKPPAMDKAMAIMKSQLLRAEYDGLNARRQAINRELADLQRPDARDYLSSGLSRSSLTSAAFPLLVAYVYWVTGAALVTAGLLYL